VQEAWLRLSRSDTAEVENLTGWLTTVTARVCLDMLRSRKTRREDALEPDHRGGLDPEQEAVLADSVGLAMLVVLETLTPAERVAFVLHDMFDLPFEEIAPIVGRTSTATRQLASRARRRVQGADVPDDRRRHKEVVDAFLAASREGNLQGLIALLDPNIAYRADEAAVLTGSPKELQGAGAVAAVFAGRARAARVALIDGEPGLVWSQGGAPRAVFKFTIAQGRVEGIDLIYDPETIAGLELEFPA